MNSPTPIVFFGSSALSAEVLSTLLSASQYTVCAVVTQPAPDGGHKSTQDTPVALLAQEHDLPLYRPHKVIEILNTLKGYNAPLGVLFAYGQILPAEILSAFPLGIVNIHPSLLPRHRGPSPIEAAILAGDTEGGTSIMLLESQMDAGPILAQQSWHVEPTISKQDLTDSLLAASQSLLIPTIDNYVAGTLVPQAQDHTKATHCHLIQKSDGKLDPAVESAVSIARKVRAFAGWPSTSIPILVRESPALLKLHSVTLLDETSLHDHSSLEREGGTLVLHLPHGTIRIESAQLPGRSIVSGADLCNGPELRLTS